MSEQPPQQFSISVGQYGHPQLRTARHWAILVENMSQPTPWTGNATAYQVSGSTETYEYARPDIVNVKEDAAYMGRILVGFVNSEHKEAIADILSRVPITHGDLGWNCQNWVALGLQALADAGIQVKVFTQPELREMLEDVRA